jgi:hypothetical protein
MVLSIGGGIVLALVTSGAWSWKTRAPLLKEVALDLKAGARARGAEDQYKRFLELRYGSMTNPANRQKVFLGYFDTNHLEGMYRLVSFMNAGERKKNIAASAEWLAEYRENMTVPERDALMDWMRSPKGRANIQRASGIYRSREIGYRAATEPVIRELMTTLGELQQEASPR